MQASNNATPVEGSCFYKVQKQRNVVIAKLVDIYICGTNAVPNIVGFDTVFILDEFDLYFKVLVQFFAEFFFRLD